jgi:hypothetical protein
MKPLRRLSIAALMALLTTNLAAAPAWAETVNCTTGTLTISNSVVTGHTGCAGIAIVPAGVTSIGTNALGFNTHLSSITIPSSVTSIGARAFYGTTALETVTFEAGSSLPSIGTEAFYAASALKSIIIPKSVLSIGYRAFFGTTALETVTFEAGSSLSSIGTNAFEEARGLKSIIIPSSVASIGDRAFESASSLKTVTFETGGAPTSIGDYAFLFATSLESITIPSSVASIGDRAFESASSLKTVTFEGDAPSVGSFVFWNAAASAVANVGFLAKGFGDRQTWEGLTVVRASAAPTPAPAAVPEPSPYSGPIPTNYSDRSPVIGDQVVITGVRLNLVTSCTIDRVTAVMSNQSADSFTITIPNGITSGLKDLVMTGPNGKLTAQGALTIQQSIPAITNEASVPSKVNSGSFNRSIAVYAKGHKGKTLSWKFAGKWFKTTITSDYQVLQRKTAAVGLDVDVQLYIDGKKQSMMTVRTK